MKPAPTKFERFVARWQTQALVKQKRLQQKARKMEERQQLRKKQRKEDAALKAAIKETKLAKQKMKAAVEKVKGLHGAEAKVKESADEVLKVLGA